MKNKVCNFKDGVKVYHISSGLYNDLRPLAFQTGNRKMKRKTEKLIGGPRYNSYQYELNFFLEKPTQEMVDKLIDAGFVNWENNGLYIYEVNLEDVAEYINYISVTSHPEMQEYNDKTWNEWYKKHKHLPDDEYFEAKDKRRYEKELVTGIKSKMSLDEFKEAAESHKWCNLDYFVDLNINKGSKKQYASYIPHIHVSVKGPIEYTDMLKLVNKNMVFYHGSGLGGLKKIKTNPSRLTKKPAVFGTPNKSFATIFCNDWDDTVLSVRTVDHEVFITEVYPGAINETYKDKTGYVYTISSDGFIQDDNIRGQEFVTYKDKKVIKEEKVVNILDKLIKDRNIHLTYL